MPRVDLLTEKRKKTIKSRYGNFDHDLGKFEILFTKAQESDFLSGRIREFKASFDWLLAPTNYPKVLEGNYDNRSQEAKGYVYGGGNIANNVRNNGESHYAPEESSEQYADVIG